MEEKLLGRFFEKSPIAYAYQKILLNAQGEPIDYEILDLNDAMERLISAKSAAVMGRRFREVFESSDAGKIERWIQICGDVALNNKTITVNQRDCFFGKDLSAKVFTLDKFYFATIFVDAQAPRLLNNVIDGFIHSNLDMLCVLSEFGRFVKINRAFENILGYSSAELDGKELRFFLHPEDVAEVEDTLKAVRVNKEVTTFVSRCRHKAGSYKDIEWRAEAEDNHIFSSAREVTESRRRERELNQRNEELAELAEILQASNEKLQAISTMDELTGLYNRHFFDQKITAEIERADRYNEPLSLIIFDLDHFKRVNDAHGHPVGDEVLKQTARVAGKNIRNADVLVRFGGEEFIVLLPQTTREGAIEAAEKLRAALAEYNHGNVGAVTASFGVAERFRSESFKSWYKRADESLYQAKTNGRNCVFCHTQETLPVVSVNIHWRKEWESGNTDIDEQHRELLALANGLIALSLTAVEPEKVAAQLDRFLQHVVYHFEQEINVLIDAGYPETARHDALHKSLAAKALHFKESYQRSDLKPSAFFSFIVDEVVMEHLLREDTQFFPYISRR